MKSFRGCVDSELKLGDPSQKVVQRMLVVDRADMFL